MGTGREVQTSTQTKLQEYRKWSSKERNSDHRSPTLVLYCPVSSQTISLSGWGPTMLAHLQTSTILILNLAFRASIKCWRTCSHTAHSHAKSQRATQCAPSSFSGPEEIKSPAGLKRKKKEENAWNWEKTSNRKKNYRRYCARNLLQNTF